MNNNFTKFTIHPSTYIFFALVLLCISAEIFICFFICAFFHEIGHIGSACLLKAKIKKVTVYPYGAEIKFESNLLPYYKDVLISLSGPFMNIILALIGHYFGTGDFFIIYNIVLCIMNLLPINNLDGGAVLYGSLCFFLDGSTAFRILKAVSTFFLFILWVLSSYSIFLPSSDPSSFVIVSYMFFLSFLKKS